MMEEKSKPRHFRPEIREWAVRVVKSEESEKGRDAAIEDVATKVGCRADTVARWVRFAEAMGGMKPGLFTPPKQRISEMEAEIVLLKRENAKLREELKSYRIVRPAPPANPIG